MLKKLLSTLGAVIVFVLLLLITRTLLHTPSEAPLEAEVDVVQVDQEALLKHMSEAVRFRTVSYQSKSLPTAEFEGFINWLIGAYPDCLLYTSPSPRD